MQTAMLQAMNAARQAVKPTADQLKDESVSSIFRKHLSPEDRKEFILKLNEKLHEGLTAYDSVTKHRMIPTESLTNVSPITTIELYSFEKSWAILTEIEPKRVTTTVSEHDVTFTDITYDCTAVLEVLSLQTCLIGVVESRFKATYYLTQEMMRLIKQVAIDCASR